MTIAPPDVVWNWPTVLKEESEGRGEGETAYQDERHQPVVVVLVMSVDVLATNPVAYVSLLQRQAFSMPSWMHVVLFLARPVVWDDASFTYDVVLPSTKAPVLLPSMGLQEETLAVCARELKGWLETWLVACYRARGAAASHEKHYRLALEAYSKARTLQPAQADLWEHIGDAYSQLDQYTEALEAYTLARDRDCENTQRYRDVGDALYNLERHEEAVHAYTQGLALDKTDVTLYNGLCEALISAFGHGRSLFRLQRCDELP